MSGEIVNLRAVGTDTANPRSGTLVGQATLLDGRVSDTTTVLTTWSANPGRMTPRLFVLAQGTFAFGGSVTAEYIEVVPIEVSVTFEGA